MDFNKYLIKRISLSSFLILIIFINIIILILNFPSPVYIGSGRITWRGVVYVQTDTQFVCLQSYVSCVFNHLIVLIIAIGYPFYPVCTLWFFLSLLNKYILYLKVCHEIDCVPVFPGVRCHCRTKAECSCFERAVP